MINQLSSVKTCLYKDLNFLKMHIELHVIFATQMCKDSENEPG